MTITQLQYVVTIAEKGSMNEAAKALFVAQPSLTNAVKELEAELQITIFNRSNRGITVSSEGKEFLGYARQVLEQAALLEERYKNVQKQRPRFSVSTQHYSFAVEAFAEVIRAFDASAYEFTLRETQTYEIIEDVSHLVSEIGVIYLSEANEKVMDKLMRQHQLLFEPLFEATPHVFIYSKHPLAHQEAIRIAELDAYPYLSFEQGANNAFYYSEEILNTLDRPKNIKVRDRATLFNLLIGLDGYTVSSGVISETLNGKDIIAKPLLEEGHMRIGIIRKKDVVLSRYANYYIDALHRILKA